MPTALLTTPDITPTIEAATRREFLATLAAAGLLTGCVGETGEPAPQSATRVVRDAYGEVTVPVEPRRVVAMDVTAIAYLLDLGLVPIAAGTYSSDFYGQTPFHPSLYTRGLTDAVATFDMDSPNLEQIAALGPDLVVGGEPFVDRTLRDRLLGIAPTVVFPRTAEATFRDELVALAALLGRDGQAADLLAALDADLAARITLPIDTVSVIRPFDDGTFDLFTGRSAAGVAITALGVTAVPDIDPSTSDRGLGRVDLSGERLGEMTGQALVVLADPETSADAPYIVALEANPLYAALPAVQAGRVVFADTIALGGGAGVGAVVPEVERLAADIA